MYKYWVNKSHDMSRDHFAKNRKLLTNWWPVLMVIKKESGVIFMFILYLVSILIIF